MQERRKMFELGRIDKVLFILPFLTLADGVSTRFSLMFGGMEGGPIAGPVHACMRVGRSLNMLES